MDSPREWQRTALEKFAVHKGHSFLLEATPGAGKTKFSAFCAQDLLNIGAIDFVIIVVPTVAIKGDKDAGFLGDWHSQAIEIQTSLKAERDPPREYKGSVVTYQQLPNLISAIGIWAGNGLRILSILDEVHHATDENVWGQAAEALAAHSTRVLAMTGTPFRSDGLKISFVNYDATGRAIADFQYSYREAVADGVCRDVEFLTDDSVASYVKDEEQNDVRISEADTAQSIDAAKVLFLKNSDWLETIIRKADSQLDEFRSWDHDAGGIVICRPGKDQASDARYLHQIANVVERVTGERPITVSYDDNDASAKIEAFRKSKARWICAVRKISEGVDIKRLRVEVMAHRPTTELLFRQLVGRVVRVDDEKRPGNAILFIAKFPELQGWAARIKEEAEAGLRKRKPPNTRTGIGDDFGNCFDFTPLGASHEDGGAISGSGDRFSAAEMNAASRLKKNNLELLDIPDTKIALILRQAGVVTEEAQPADDPLQIRKDRIRCKLAKRAQQLGIRVAGKNGSAEQISDAIKKVWKRIHKFSGAKNIDDLCDNHGIEKMQEILDLLDSWLASGGGRATASG